MCIKKVKEMVKFSVSKNLQNRWFIFLNIIILVIMIITTNIENIKNFLESRNIQLFHDAITIEIIDKENIAVDAFLKHFANREKITIQEIAENNYTEETIPDTTIVVEITTSPEEIIKTVITSKEGIDGNVYNEIVNVLYEIRNSIFSQENEIALSKLQLLSQEPKVERIMLGVQADNYATKEIIKQVSTMLTYVVSILIFSKIANEIAQEKVSKSIEYILTSVSEKDYLLAKIISVIVLVLLQAIYFILYYFIGNLLNNIIHFGTNHVTGETFNMLAMMQNIDKEIIIYIITVFVYGIFTLVLMSIIQAAISSKTTTMSEAGNTILLLTTITVIAYLLTLGWITPYTNMTPIVYVISCIPLLSNYFIPAIMIIGQATPLQIIISFVLLILSIPIAFRICAKIFKNGVLDYQSKIKQRGIKHKKERNVKEEQEHKLLINRYKQYAFVIGMAFILWAIVQIVGQVLVGTFLVPLLGDMLNSNQLVLLLTLVISIISLMISYSFIQLYTTQEDKLMKSCMPIKEKIHVMFIGIFCLEIVQLILPHIYQWFGINHTISDVLSVQIDGEILTNILLFITLAVVPAIFEELLFRKAIINFSQKIGTGFSILFSAFLFALVHMNFEQGIFAFLIGMIFAMIYFYTKDIKITMGLHFLNNGYAVLMLIGAENQYVLNFLSILAILSGLIGAIFLWRAILMNKGKEMIQSIKTPKSMLRNCRYLFLDYTFIVSIVFMGLVFFMTENLF